MRTEDEAQMKSQNEARLKTEDASENLHLSLVNSVKDNDNPNPGLYTFDERAQGKGSWVVVINSGYNWEQVPEEFGRPDDPRPLRIWRVPHDVRNRELEQHELEQGYWQPNDDYDYGYPFEGVPEGHGTQTAIVAAGLQSGAAREAGLYMIKAGGAVLDKDGHVVEEEVLADSLLVALRHVVEKLREGTLVMGKTVMVIDTLWTPEDMRREMNNDEDAYQDWFDELRQLLHDLDGLGAVVAISAGNDGKQNPVRHTDTYVPNIIAAETESPLIIVGAVNSKGQLAMITTPGTTKLPITCYAMGTGLKLIDLSIEEKFEQHGTTFSAAIVAGLIACYLSHPDFLERFKWSADDSKGNTVGNRVKNWLHAEGHGSYQRVAADNQLDEPKSRHYPVPARINTSYNYAHGSQRES